MGFAVLSEDVKVLSGKINIKRLESKAKGTAGPSLLFEAARFMFHPNF
jgi:hypothetical protein